MIGFLKLKMINVKIVCLKKRVDFLKKVYGLVRACLTVFYERHDNKRVACCRQKVCSQCQFAASVLSVSISIK